MALSVCVCAHDILSIQAFIGALMLMHTFNLVVCASLHAYYLLRNCLSFIFFLIDTCSLSCTIFSCEALQRNDGQEWMGQEDK